jgi:hypothetical protein
MNPEEAKQRDRELAKWRMRRLRAGGRPYDKARQYATRDLVAAHRDEFDRLFREHLYTLQALQIAPIDGGMDANPGDSG